jgi:hypothetical protein
LFLPTSSLSCACTTSEAARSEERIHLWVRFRWLGPSAAGDLSVFLEKIEFLLECFFCVFSWEIRAKDVAFDPFSWVVELQSYIASKNPTLTSPWWLLLLCVVEETIWSLFNWVGCLFRLSSWKG